jgi:enterochelin esterase-like enzyme
MGLTSGPFITLMMILALAALAATVWLWPRVAGRRLRDLGARVGLLAVCQVLVITAFLVAINNYFSFFGSWAEMFGTAAPPPIRLAGVSHSARPIQITASDLGPAPGGGSVLPIQADGVIATRAPGAAGTITRPAGNPGPRGLTKPSGLMVPGLVAVPAGGHVPGGVRVPGAVPSPGEVRAPDGASLPGTAGAIGGSGRVESASARRGGAGSGSAGSGGAGSGSAGSGSAGSGGAGSGGAGSGGAGSAASIGPGPLAGLHAATGKLRPSSRRSGGSRDSGRVQFAAPGQLGPPAVNGEVLQVSMRGERTGISVSRDYIYLPPQYFQRAYAHARFPVVLALTGYPNDTWSIIKRLALPATAARMVAAKKIRPAIYLMMNVSPALPRDTECTNVPAGLQVFSFFAVDVPRAMEQMFRVQPGRSGWATLGYSTGGYCAAKLAMLDPGQFGNAVSMAGYYSAIQDQTTGDLYGGSAGYQNENNLNWRLEHLPAPPVSVLVTSSRVGERSLPGTLAFLQLIHAPMHGYSLILPQGGHNYRTWDRQLPQSLEWLSKRLTPAVPQQSGAALQR